MGKIRAYEGKDITILYDVARCFHAEECIHGAPGVFRKDARPWVHADGEDPSQTAEIIQRCPTGALHYRAKDEAFNERPHAENIVTVTANGPLQETRAAFCRCGASANKPFCDDSHSRIGFSDSGPNASAAATDANASGGKLALTPAPNGPLLAKGKVIIKNASGETVSILNQTAFCRCGASANKPFCDGSHQRIGFVG
jgi:CDGSH-type Zn-finger protein/uncharacterized Fe-S cluster protein YjdI